MTETVYVYDGCNANVYTEYKPIVRVRHKVYTIHPDNKHDVSLEPDPSKHMGTLFSDRKQWQGGKSPRFLYSRYFDRKTNNVNIQFDEVFTFLSKGAHGKQHKVSVMQTVHIGGKDINSCYRQLMTCEKKIDPNWTIAGTEMIFDDKTAKAYSDWKITKALLALENMDKGDFYVPDVNETYKLNDCEVNNDMLVYRYSEDMDNLDPNRELFIPHTYQKYAINFIETHPISALLLDMGLGKTVITLTALKDQLERGVSKKVLVIAPVRVAKNTWPEEIEKWQHLKGLTYSLVVGTPKQREKALDAKADIYIISRDNVAWLVSKSEHEFDFDTMVIDELSSFKNGQSKRFRMLMAVRPTVERVIGLTGTPAPNGLMDLWAEFKLLDMGQRLGIYITYYRNAYFVPDKRNGMIIYSWKPLPGSEEAIYNKISDITVSMKAEDYLDMPEVIRNETKVYMEPKERDTYDTMRKNMAVGDVTASNAAVLSNKLEQMANGAVYSDDGGLVAIHDQKLDALEDMIESMCGEPLLIAYWYKHDLLRIEQRLKEKGISYERIDTEDSIARWNRGEIPVALIHPASAGHGLNLQHGGSHIVWFSLTWNLELYDQLNARLNRQGQKSGTVVITHIITDGTIDSAILRALNRKENTQATLIEAVKAELG